MKATSYGFYAAIIALSVGCGAADYVEDSERSAVADIEATTDDPAAGESLATNDWVAGDDRRLAKIEFEAGQWGRWRVLCRPARPKRQGHHRNRDSHRRERYSLP